MSKNEAKTAQRPSSAPRNSRRERDPGSGALRGMIALVIALMGACIYLGFRDNLPAGNADMFMEACVDKPLAGSTPGEYCHQISTIRRAYGVDPAVMIERQRILMAKTARRVASGELKRASAYEACISKGECAPVPLLPDNADRNAVAGGSAYLETRKAFWQLTENHALTPEICTFIPVCKALRQAGAITFGSGE